MANEQLDAFLAGKPASEPAPPAEPQAPVEAEAADTPTEQPEPSPAAPEATETPPDGQPEKETREPQHFRELRTSVEAAKREREDWKARAIRAETEHADLRKQFEAAQQQRAPVQAQAAPPQMDIREAMAQDPSIKAAVLTRLDTSEMILRREIGDEAVNELQQSFTEAMGRDPTLQARVLTQRDPYRWAHKHMESLRLQQAIGDDPAAYRAQLRAEVEAEIMAGRTNGNGGVAGPRTSPAAGMAPSLAQTRSAAPRGASGWSGPQSLEQILAQPRK